MNAAPTITIHIAETDIDIQRCFPVMCELRRHLTEETFLPTIRRMQENGYVLVMMEADGQVVAVAGYRYSEHLARGKFMYIDDLVTRTAARRTGYGARLFQRLVDAAKGAGCAQLHLDSGIHRAEAHLFYEALGMRFTSRHYSLSLT